MDGARWRGRRTNATAAASAAYAAPVLWVVAQGRGAVRDPLPILGFSAGWTGWGGLSVCVGSHEEASAKAVVASFARAEKKRMVL